LETLKIFCLDIAKMHDASNSFLLKKGLLQATNLILVFFLLLGVGVFIWSSNKGFDFTDEGLYLLVYQHPHEFPDSYTSYHRVGSIVFDLVGGNIIILRLVGFFLTALATLYFSYALTWFLAKQRLSLFENSNERVLLHLAVQGSVLSAYCWLPPTPNYNTMAGIGMLLSCGGILAFFSSKNLIGSLAKVGFGIFAMGSGLLLAFLAKGSSAVGIVVISFLLLGACSLIGLKEKLVFAALASLAVVAGGGFLFLLMPGLFASWEFFLGSLVALTEGNGAREIIMRHWQESMDFAMRHLRSFIFPILLALGVVFFARSRLFKKSPESKEKMVFWMVVGVLIVEVVLLIVRDVFSAGIQGRAKSFIGYSSVFLLLLTLRVGLPRFVKSTSLQVGGFLVFLLWLAILPFVTAAGTTHKIFINALLHAAPLSAAILILAASIDKDLRKAVVLPWAGILLGVLGFCQFLMGFVITPYRTLPKWTQTVSVKVGVPGTFLKLDPASAECIQKTKAILASAGFQPGDDILALYGLPGLVYAVGGVSPQRPWFFDNYGQIGHEENLRALKRIPLERISKALIIHTKSNPIAIEQLKSCEISFAESFQQIGKISVPPKNTSADIWFPIKKPSIFE